MSLGVGGNGETMRAQQKLLQKITRELDAEREASSTAASEALSMILRLQGEKAALEMEASQYKRLAEEKMCHAETSLTLFEDLIYRKEMEMASLEFQVQAYRCKLLSLGCSDQAEEKKKGDVESSSSLSPRKDLSACWEQIRMIDDRVREVSESRDVPKGSKWGLLRRESISHALVSQVSNTILESAKSDVSSIMEMLKNPDREVPRTKESLAFISEERNVSRYHHLCYRTNGSSVLIMSRENPQVGGKMASSKHELLKVTSIEAEYTSLLKEIREQISVMQSEMRGLRSELQQTRFVSHREECPALNSIQEAMLHFWL
ncbi:hypothetical protein Rs2_44404 [Raphanus sativus]|nr:hypothetical protein Rs2_44404 [Raphanus sativus]